MKTIITFLITALTTSSPIWAQSTQYTQAMTDAKAQA